MVNKLEKKLSINHYALILFLFLSWRVLLFLFLALAVSFVSLQKDFLGGGLGNYLKAPHLWAWINFDGEHYLSIAKDGYVPLRYFFFPIYPLIVGNIARLFNGSIIDHAVVGLLVSNASFLLGLIGFIKLIKLDFKKEIVYLSVFLLILFPTSFYFASFYTESLFFALVVWSFYFARKKMWLLAGVLGAVSTATRVVGVALIPALMVELWQQRNLERKTSLIEPVIAVLLIPLGIVFYMVYLNKVTGDPLEFFHSVGIFGEQRSSSFILLPQVFYRYIFKILPKINYSYMPVVFTTWLEFVVAIIFGFLGVLGFLKLRLSYAVYFAIGFIIPTLSGSFSSLPRYILVLFPGFILLALIFSRLSRPVQFVLYTLLFMCLGMATSLFVRGYWIA